VADVEGEHAIAASPEAVASVLTDLAPLCDAIPGCESLEAVAAGEAKAVLNAEIGSFAARFTGTFKAENNPAPRTWTFSGDARGRPAGSLKAGGRVEIVPDGENAIVRYAGSFELGGKAADVPAGEVDAYIRNTLSQFFESVGAAASAGKWVDQLDHSLAGVQFGDEPSEDVVIDKRSAAGEMAEDVESQIELAAGRSRYGGPMVWGLGLLIVVIVILAIATS